MPPWGSKWLEREVTRESFTDENAAESKASSSSRHHGAWFNVVRGIRRSLDVHLKSYYKVDTAFASTLKFTSPSDKLQALSRSLTDTGLVDFCCIQLVHPSRGTFGIVAISGSGSELYPSVLSEEAAQRAARSCDVGASPSINVFTRCVFQVKDSNWAVEDVVASKAPWYYDCASAVNGFGLPQDGAWLRRAGMRSVLALPCLQFEVTGVLTVASKHKTLDHLLLRKLEDLCFKVTPIVADAVTEHAPLLCNRRVAARYESICDFAHEVLGEVLNLDRAVALSVAGSCRNTHANAATSTAADATATATSSKGATVAAAPPAAVRHHGMGMDRRDGSCGSRGHRGDDGASRFDAAAAMAAAAAAGFSWTAPSAPSVPAAPLPTAGCGRIQAALAAVACARQQEELQQQEQAECKQSLQSSETFCSALTGTSSDELFSAALPLEPLPVVPRAEADPAAAAASVPLALPAQLVNPAMSRSLPARCDDGSHDQVVDLFLRAAPTECPRQLQPPQQQQPASTSGCCPSRSTRSLSCLEFSSGVSASEVREALAGDYSGSQAACSPRFQQSQQQQDTVASGCWTSRGVAFQRLLAPQHCDSQCQRDGAGTPVMASGVCLRQPQTLACSSNRTTESGAGEGGYMLETCTTEELARAPLGGGCGGFMASPSMLSSRNTERRVIHRVPPLEPSVGVVTAAASGSRSRVAPVASAPAFMAARSSTTDASGGPAADSTFITATITTHAGFGHTFLAAGGSTAHWAAGCSVSRKSNLTTSTSAWASEAGRGSTAVDCCKEAAADSHVLVGRWSRDSAAAAAVWSNEAAEAFAAAMRFTASHQQPGHRAPSVGRTSGWVSHYRGSAPMAAVAAATQPELHACSEGNGTALGGLYGIRESGPVPSLALSLDESSDSGSEDFGVSVIDASPATGFFLSSGLGAEAQQRHLALPQPSSVLLSHPSQSEGAFLASGKVSPLLSDSLRWAQYGEVRS